MEKDVEGAKPRSIPWLKMVYDQGIVTDDIRNWDYEGSGTEDDPYIVEWIDDDPRNPMNWATWVKWSLTQLVAVATLAVAFVSSAYSGGIAQIAMEFGGSNEVNTLGISLFVLGFAIGPLLWAPMSELFGRQYLFIGTYMALTAFNAGAAGANNLATLIVLRFLAGAFGSSPLTNAGGVIADMFTAAKRGLATTLFAAAPFLGPVLGPIVGGFVGETIGWRWIEGIMAIFTGVLWIVGTFLIPETYAPVLLRKRAERLSKETGKVYKSRVDAEQGVVTLAHAYKTALSRPWILLFTEPIVLLLSIYMAIIYGTLYMLFAAYPIVYQEARGWSQGIGGLAFIGVAIGMGFAITYAVWDNSRYIKAGEKDPSGFAPPEARLPVCCVGGIAVPIGLFWFAWTNYPSLPWAASIAAGIPFGFGMVLVFLGIMNYLIDAYTIFAASVLAANAVLRSLFGAIFPLFTTYMYDGLGIHWASTIPAFLALACVPFPFLFYKYGPAIRVRCKYAAEADQFLKKMRGQLPPEEKEQEESSQASEDLSAENEKDRDQYNTNEAAGADDMKRVQTEPEGEGHLRQRPEAEREAEAIDYSYDDEAHQPSAVDSRFQTIRTEKEQKTKDRSALSRSQSRTSMKSNMSAAGHYEGNPYDLDRFNTKESFRPKRSRTNTTTSANSSKSKVGNGLRFK